MNMKWMAALAVVLGTGGTIAAPAEAAPGVRVSAPAVTVTVGGRAPRPVLVRERVVYVDRNAQACRPARRVAYVRGGHQRYARGPVYVMARGGGGGGGWGRGRDRHHRR